MTAVQQLNYLLQLEAAGKLAKVWRAAVKDAAVAVPGVTIVSDFGGEIVVEGDEKALAEFRKRCDLPA